MSPTSDSAASITGSDAESSTGATTPKKDSKGCDVRGAGSGLAFVGLLLRARRRRSPR